jgi:hypothetical protein
MTKHPGRTFSERRVLDAIGCGDPIPPKTRPALLRRLVDDGLLEKIGPTPRMETYYQMSIATHIQWCDYWSEQESSE